MPGERSLHLVRDEPLPGWEQSLMAALGGTDEELARMEPEQTLRITLEIPAGAVELLNAARASRSLTLRRYLQRCLALGLSRDLQRGYGPLWDRLKVGDD